MILFLVLP